MVQNPNHPTFDSLAELMSQVLETFTDNPELEQALRDFAKTIEADRCAPDYVALLDEARNACADLDEMLDGYMDAHGAEPDELNQSRCLYNPIAAIQRALGRPFTNMPLEGEDGEEQKERELADIGGIPT